ncbi:MAG: LysR family transcriptional regulator [Solirubrobacteraceae bacterium]
MLETRQARYFVAVAEELHFGRAAARLGIAQPPLSAAIKRLETQLGARLLERTSRDVALTPAGEALLEEARALLAQADRAARAATRAAQGQRGQLSVGSVASAFHDLLPAALPRFRARHPDVRLTLHEVDTAPAVRQLHDRRLDLALIRLDRDQPGLCVTPLHRDPLVAALPTAHPLARRKVVRLRELASEAWIFVPREVSPPYHDQILAACRHAGFSPRVQHHSISIQTQIAMVACGLGVALVPASTQRLQLDDVAYRPLARPVVLLELAIVTRDRPPSPALTNLVATLGITAVSCLYPWP